MCSGSDKTPFVTRQTPTHLFEEGDRIGTGGSCDVYCGVEKGTGRRHALKVLREPTPAQQSQLLQEAETLSKIHCSKIVRFFGHNYEVETGRPVVILENCSGGSLLAFLQQPENSRGLEDDDFRALLSDLVEALSHLRAVGVVHRDVKPGNILRHIHTSGRCEYKLSDFGASREAEDTKQMTSIVGTEEYLHPDMYKTAFFGHHTHSAMNPISGELWSVGCTLYHAMTATLPFRPLGGARNNRKAMLVMISQKPSGAISGDQCMDGTFRWNTVPPSDCRMSESLREKITPLLKNLLETDSRRQWNFPTFLDESQRILGMRGFHVCDTECGELFRLYLEPKQSLAELQDALAYHTEVPAGQQLLFHRVQPLHSMLSAAAQVKDLPLTQDDQPLLLVSPYGTEGRCRRLVLAQPQMLGVETTLEEDITASFKACSDLYSHYLKALTFTKLVNLFYAAVLALRSTLTSNQSTVETRFRVLSATCQERQSRLAILTQLMETLHPNTSSMGEKQPSKISVARLMCDQDGVSANWQTIRATPHQSGPSQEGDSRWMPQSLRTTPMRRRGPELRDSLWKLKYRLEEVRKGSDLVRFDNPLSMALVHNDSAEAVQHIFSQAKEIWLRMQERRQKIPLSEIEQDKHKGDKATINRLCLDSVQRMKALTAKRSKLLEEYTVQIRRLYDRLQVAQEVDRHLLNLKEESEQFSALLDEIWKVGSEDLRIMADANRSSSMVNSFKPLQNQLGELLSEGLPTLETFHLNPSGTEPQK